MSVQQRFAATCLFCCFLAQSVHGAAFVSDVLNWDFDDGSLSSTGLSWETYHESTGVPMTATAYWDSDKRQHIRIANGLASATGLRGASLVENEFGPYSATNWVIETRVRPTGNQLLPLNSSPTAPMVERRAGVILSNGSLFLQFTGDGSGTGTVLAAFLAADMYRSSALSVESDADLVANDQWAHLALSYRYVYGEMPRKEISLYVNGELIGSDSVAVSVGPYNSFDPVSLFQGFNGDMDAIRVRTFTGSISPSEFVLLPEPGGMAAAFAAMSFLIRRRRD